MLLAILRKSGDVQIVDTEEEMVVYVLSMQERAQVVDVCGKVLEGHKNNLMHVHHNTTARTADEDSNFRRKQQNLKTTLSHHPKFKAYVNEDVKTGPQIITAKSGVLELPRHFNTTGKTGF